MNAENFLDRTNNIDGEQHKSLRNMLMKLNPYIMLSFKFALHNQKTWHRLKNISVETEKTIKPNTRNLIPHTLHKFQVALDFVYFKPNSFGKGRLWVLD